MLRYPANIIYITGQLTCCLSITQDHVWKIYSPQNPTKNKTPHFWLYKGTLLHFPYDRKNMQHSIHF